MSKNVERLFDLLDHLQENYDKEVILAGKSTGKWDTLSTKQFVEESQRFSIGLMKLGYQKGDKIITVCNSRPEWNIFDMGMAQLGIIHVPLYPNLSVEEYEYLINHSEAKAVIIGNKVIYQRIKDALKKFPNLHVFTIDEIEGQENYDDVMAVGNGRSKGDLAKLQEVKDTINKDDIATIIYTSGTTGDPKGVMLSHYNIMSNAVSTTSINPLNEQHKVLSFLPLSHVYERMLNYHYLYRGISVYYAQNMGTIANNLIEIKADGFSTVPRFLEKVYDKIIGKGKDLTGIKKHIFFRSLKIAEKYEPFKKQGPCYALQLKIARKLVFSKWQDALGGNIKLIVSGGAALQPRLGRIFGAAGLLIQEGYGLSETSPVIAVNYSDADRYRLGTVGPVIDGVNVRIAEDGEILVKGPNIMKGYYKDPEYTKEVIDEDGWFHTGDIGVLEDDKFLKITDRKKSIFKLSSGKYIAPQLLENKLKESSFIEQAMVVGENEKYVGTVITPNFDYLHFWASKHKIHYANNKELVLNEQLIKRFQREINTINKTLSPHEQLKKFTVVPDEWTPESGELSATLKLKRDKVARKYQTEIEKMF
ncbi:long-chain fatty acid--CoA ligase [Puteibacter caeruleilacunae]|nr:long-chain fatty acid--CoA ligase [Puteibacter caeruleilacunae]